MVHFCFALRSCTDDERRKIIIAGCFHDLGIWTNDTFDYLSPSMALARQYLRQHELEQWIPEIELMIDLHHKLRPYRDERYPLVEVFRKADLIDVSLGVVSYGMRKTLIKRVQGQFPDAGFHKRLVQLAGAWLAKHPLNPLPILKW
jgi:hypothetical protein